MRLHSVKITGFKSFADPTTIVTDVPVLCVVGPNGCGKSNVVEAINWVMGETRASQLRGESMQNVIFNGTRRRKATDWCSVEMRLEDVDAGPGAPSAWRGYPEVVIKRQLGRDGASTYRINNQVVRRRDIHDLFSGTGLGAHGYSVILQGAVSRIVEDNPMHIRSHLEEAAGVTHYKDRRRETESRLSHAHGNRERLEGLAREMEGQVATLERQASAALRHRKLSGEMDRLRKLALEWRAREAEGRLGALAEERRAKSAEEKALAGERKALLERAARLRKDHAGLVGRQQGAQARAHRLGTRVATVTQQLENFNRERSGRETLVGELEESLARQREGLGELGRKGDAAQAALDASGKRLAEIDREISGHEESLDRWQRESDEKRAAHGRLADDCRRRRHLLETAEMRLSMAAGQAESLGETIAAAESKLAAVEAESARLKAAQERTGEARDRLGAAEKGRAGHERRLGELGRRLAGLAAARQELGAEEVAVETERRLLLSVEGGLGGDAEGWVRKKGITPAQALTEQVGIDAPGWEGAVDAALGARIVSYLVEDPHALADDGSPLPARVSLVRAGGGGGAGARPRPAAAGLVPLADRVGCEERWRGLLAGLLAGFYAAPDLAAARELLHLLGEGECLVTPNGELCAADRVQGPPAVSRGYGWGARMRGLERRGKALAGRIAAHARDTEAAEAERKAAEAALSDARARADACAAELRAAEKEEIENRARGQWLREQRKELQGQAKRARAGLRKAERDAAGLRAEAGKVREGLAQAERAAERSARDVAAAGEEASGARERHARLVGERRRQDEIRQRAIADAGVWKARAESARERAGEIGASLERERAALAGMDAGALEKSRREGEAGLAEADREAQRLVDEASRLLAEIEENETRRQGLEERLAAAHDRAQQIGFEEETQRAEAARMRAEMDGIDAEVDDALRRAFPDAGQAGRRLERAAASRDRLGDVNFAAEAELAEARERVADLERQRGDVAEAIENLREAIGRIDREMRARLEDVFGRLSERFDELFRTVFRGGSAGLELDGESLLDAGVKLKARPPGKRVDRLHLLSGGEKSLVAIAFILAIFSLNPAPFCVMDEVDAALDDRNTQMFNDLIREFSDRVQFIVVTHNKITLDVAQRLVGITQPETGVSTLVTVKTGDVDRFVEPGKAA